MRSPLCALVMLFVCDGLSIAQQELSYTSPRDLSAPEWVRLMYGANPDPALVTEAYEIYYRANPFEKNSHTQYYKRWIRGISRELPPVAKARKPEQQRSVMSQWECIGPWDWDHTAADRSYAPGAAHIYTVEQSASHPDILYAGTATSGIWKSTDRGASWTPLTEQFRTLSVTALEISHDNSAVVYAELESSIYKTTDGGTHWLETGSADFQNLSLDVHDIVMHPENTEILFAATSAHLYRTTNGGDTWTSIIAGEFQEIEFHPLHPDTIYTVRRNGVKTQFYRSVNGGESFQLFTHGWPNPNTSLGEHQKRVELAVSLDAPDHVYALATGTANGGSGLFGVYVSMDAGASWEFTCCGPQPGGPPSQSNPNLMGWSDLGLDDGGQYYYDLAFAVSPTNADSMFVAGVNLWVSGNGGASFVCPAKWSHPHKPNYVHADIHDIHFYPGTQEIWLACDGGIFYSNDNGANFHRRMTGIAGTDFWGFGAGFWDGEVMLGGTYHNGTLMCDSDVYQNGWISTDGGDNFRGFVNPGKDRQVYTDYNIKRLSGDRTVNNSTRSFNHKPNASYIVGESSDMLFHPHYFGTWYTGDGTQLWRTDDDGSTFTLVHDFGENIAAMDIAMSNPNVMYVCTWPSWWATKRIYRTSDAGASWTEITPSPDLLDDEAWVPYDIAVDATNAHRVWIVRTSMYADTDLDGRSVFTTSNGGLTWHNLTTARLDNQAFTCIMHQAGTNGGIYLGTRETVFYRSASMPDWVGYSAGLPAATFSTRIVPYYRKGKMRNGTNRSVWESPFYENSIPVAQPAVLGQKHTCIMDTVQFVDRSILNETNATWSWQIPGGSPSTSNLRNPKVVYHEAGMYDVTLTVSDVHGTHTRSVAGILEVRNVCAVDTIPGRTLKCSAFPDYVQTPALDLSGNKFTITAWVRPSGIQSDYAGIVMSDGVACGLNFREGNNTLGYHWAGSGSAWSWDSNLEVPPDRWSHVAMVVGPFSVKLYVNGREATHPISHPTVTLGALKIGNYQGWQSRNFTGLIDEVSIWNRILTLDEIRAQRHLTRKPNADPNLMLYYQFNEEHSIVYDKNQLYDGWLNGNAQRVRSRAPVGSGVSASRDILLGGTYTFGQTGLTLSFGLLDAVPLGTVYATRLNTIPDTVYSTSVPLSRGYWIFNNYGLVQDISTPEFIEFDNLVFISDEMEDAIGNSLYARSENAESGSWQSIDTQDGVLVSGEQGSVEFDDISYSYFRLGQLFPVRDSMPFGRPKTAIVHPSDTNITQRGASSAALMVHSTSKGVLLPKYNAANLGQLSLPAAGSVVYLSDKKEIACYDGNVWQIIRSDYAGPAENAGLPGASGVSLGQGNISTALLGMGSASGVLILPAFGAGNIESIAFPKEGLLVYRTDLKRLTYYDGVDWVLPVLESNPIEPSLTETVTELPGINIGSVSKHPHAILHIHDPARGLAIPVATCRSIVSPQAGLIIFDPELPGLMLFDGTGWKMVR